MSLDSITWYRKQGVAIPAQNNKVLVRCITYNQSEYIVETLNGFGIQKTEFNYVCVVIDDASTDGEQETIISFIKTECNIEQIDCYENDLVISIIAPHKSNSNCSYVFYLLKKNLFKQPTEKEKLVIPWRESSLYEAICEGDDYWTDCNKLQKQVDFLDNNPEYALCYTKCNYYYQGKGLLDPVPWGGPNETFNDFIHNNTVPTLTVLYRTESEKRYHQEVQPESRGWMMGDYPRWIWYSHEYKVKFIPDCTGVYRVLASSASHSSDVEKQIRFSDCSISIRLFFEEYFGYPKYSFVEKNYRSRRLLYLYAINHKIFNYLKTLFATPSLLLNAKAIGYMRYFFMASKKSEEV